MIEPSVRRGASSPGSARGAACVLLAILLGLLAARPAGADEAAGRRLQSLDAGWRFLRGEAQGAERADFDDRGWRRVLLPHTFNAEDGERGGAYYRGSAWYRRELDLPQKPQGRRAYLQFDGAFLVTEAWVNGRPAGRHAGGYAAFRFDVTDLLKAGRNVVAVRVDSSRRSDVAPLGGDFTAFGGLYRDVHLLWTDDLHVDVLDYGGPGVYVRVGQLSADRATIDLVVRLRNDRATPVRAVVRSVIRDAAGRAVGETSSQVELAPEQTLPLAQQASIDRPHLWDGRRDPFLYRLETTVTPEGAGAAADRVDVPLGVRAFRMDPDRGFILNGRPYPVHGVDYFHAERPGRGPAVGAAEIDEDMAILDRLGVTGLRLVHFQHPQRTYDDADRMGLVLWTEIPLNSAVDADPAFSANLDDQLKELIRQNYDHPSVVVWGLGNEVYKSDAVSWRVLDRLQHTGQTEDPTRPTTYADCCHREDDPQATRTDLTAYNRYFGWYGGEVSQFGPWADATHALLPRRPIAVSEYGAGASAFQQEDPPVRPKAASHWHPEQYQALFHEAAWRQLAARSYLWATFVWTGFDLASAGRDEGDRAGFNDKGLVTYDRRTFKDAYFWYQANWSETPMAHIASARAVRRTQPLADVKVYTNLTSVRLSVTGRDLGTRTVADHIALWRNVRLQPGANRLEVTATGPGGLTARDAARWSYGPGAQGRPTAAR